MNELSHCLRSRSKRLTWGLEERRRWLSDHKEIRTPTEYHSGKPSPKTCRTLIPPSFLDENAQRIPAINFNLIPASADIWMPDWSLEPTLYYRSPFLHWSPAPIQPWSDIPRPIKIGLGTLSPSTPRLLIWIASWTMLINVDDPGQYLAKMLTR